jgi:hypothetical protein
MTRRDPSLRLLRLVVTKSGKSVYDETFHPGINMIRSEGNSRGKSTIADLIFFSLGDLAEWKVEAGTCDQTFAEVTAKVDLFDALKDGFAGDRIWRVEKGAQGADIIHDILHNGRVRDRIVYDCENRSAWRQEYGDQTPRGSDRRANRVFGVTHDIQYPCKNLFGEIER